MAWDDTPPTAEELKATAPKWDDAPPTAEEMKMFGPYSGNAKNISFADVATESIPVLGPLVEKAGSYSGAALRNILGKDNRPVSEQYDEAEARHKADMEQYAKENQGLNTDANVLGGFMLPAPGGGLVAKTLGNAAVAGTDAYLRDENALKAGLIGGGATAFMHGLGQLTAPTLRKYAERRAVKAAGGMTKEMRDLNNAGFLQDTGRELLDKKIVTIGSSLEDIAERAVAQKEVAGQKIGNAIGEVDNLVATANQMIDSGTLFANASAKEKATAKKYLADNFQFNMENIGKRIEKELIQPNSANPLLRGEMKKMQSLADDFRMQTPQTMVEGLGIKGSQRKITNFNSDTIPQGFKQDIYGIIKEELEGTVAKTANLKNAVEFTNLEPQVEGSGTIWKNSAMDANQNRLGQLAEASEGNQSLQAAGQQAATDYKDANRQYAIMKNTEDMANKRFGAAQSNRENSLTDTIAEGAGLLHGGPIGAVAMGAVNKAMRRYGSSTAAVGADKIADMLESTPESFGKFAGALRQAASRGNSALAITHYMMSQQNPEYRETMNNVFGQPNK